MLNAVSQISAVVYPLCLIAIISFVIGYVFVGQYFKKSGSSKNKVSLMSKISTLLCLASGFYIYLSNT